MSDIGTAFTALRDKRRSYNTLWSYYEGSHPVKYATERLRDLFQDIDVHFVENWCAVVINSVYDRLELERFVVHGRDAEDEAATRRLNELFKETELDLDADDIHLASLVCGESFLLEWKNEAGDKQAYYHDPRMCHIAYDPEEPRKKLWAAKWWEVMVEVGPKIEKRYRVNLYYPDRIEYWQSTKSADKVSSGEHFEKIAEPEENPYATVPMFHFRKERRDILSELLDIIPLQDAINKLLADLMVTSEFAAIPQRYAVSNANLKSAKNAANELLVIPKGDSMEENTQVGQFNPVKLETFLQAMDKLAYAVGVISHTPRHYFYDQGGDPSGEALMTMEAPLVKKTKRFIRRYGNTWQRAAAFLLLLDSGLEVRPEDIEPIFTKPETVQPKTMAEIRKLDIDCGLPLPTVLRREGWSEEEIEEMEGDREQSGARDQAGLAKALMAAEREANRRGAQQGFPQQQPPQQELPPPPGSQPESGLPGV